jgi:guanylate kinase
MQNSLHHAKEFERILSTYRPNIDVIDILNQVTLVLLVAPAASGRNTLIRNLIMTGRYYFLVSDTTRHPRINNGVVEMNGKEYWFRTEDEFLEGLHRGAYVEAAVIHNQQVSGVSLSELQVSATHQKIAITDVDIQGADAIQHFKPDTHSIFVLPPAFEEWMRRLDTRGSIDPNEKRRRLESAIGEISDALNRDYFIFLINWDLRTTSEQLHQFVLNGDYDMKQRVAAHAHAEELLARLHQELGH